MTEKQEEYLIVSLMHKSTNQKPENFTELNDPRFKTSFDNRKVHTIFEYLLPMERISEQSQCK